MFYEITKHIDVRYHVVRYINDEGDVKVCKISSRDIILVDMFDKVELSLSYARA